VLHVAGIERLLARLHHRAVHGIAMGAGRSLQEDQRAADEEEREESGAGV
jgi:hypothetical protein